MITAGARTVVAKSCIVCFVLKMPSDFSVVGGRYLNSHCNTCKGLASRPTISRYQSTSKKVAVNNRAPWTGADISKLSQMTKDGHTIPVIAKALGRTVYATYTMRGRLERENLL